jgi:hypothetical protein
MTETSAVLHELLDELEGLEKKLTPGPARLSTRVEKL